MPNTNCPQGPHWCPVKRDDCADADAALGHDICVLVRAAYSGPTIQKAKAKTVTAWEQTGIRLGFRQAMEAVLLEEESYELEPYPAPQIGRERLQRPGIPMPPPEPPEATAEE